MNTHFTSNQMFENLPSVSPSHQRSQRGLMLRLVTSARMANLAQAEQMSIRRDSGSCGTQGSVPLCSACTLRRAHLSCWPFRELPSPSFCPHQLESVSFTLS